MMSFMILPILAIVYIAWHVWAILPLPGIWKALIIALGVFCFSLLFLLYTGYTVGKLEGE